MTEERYAVYNNERNRLLTSASGDSTWLFEELAGDAMKDEFGGGDHLEVVKVVSNY